MPIDPIEQKKRGLSGRERIEVMDNFVKPKAPGRLKPQVTKMSALLNTDPKVLLTDLQNRVLKARERLDGMLLEKYYKDQDIEKAWSDAARKAAAEARKKADHHLKTSESEYNNSGLHAEHADKASDLHEQASKQYTEAAKHYDAGRVDEGHAARMKANATAKQANAASALARTKS